MKKCSGCKEQKPFEEFNRNRRTRDGRQTFCRPCGKVASLARRNANLEEYRATSRAWVASNKEKSRENARKWHRDNPEKSRKLWEARRARKLNVPREDISVAEMVERDGNYCMLCSDELDFDLRHPDPMSVSVDHITALANGGTDLAENKQLAHLVCNLSKGAR